MIGDTYIGISAAVRANGMDRVTEPSSLHVRAYHTTQARSRLQRAAQGRERGVRLTRGKKTRVLLDRVSLYLVIVQIELRGLDRSISISIPYQSDLPDRSSSHRSSQPSTQFCLRGRACVEDGRKAMGMGRGAGSASRYV